MASVKKQLQIIQNAYETDSLNRAVLNSVDDKVIRRILKDALQPWYYVLGYQRSWLLAALTAFGVFYLTSSEKLRLPVFDRVLWGVGSFGLVWLGYGFITWLRSDYKSKLGMVWVMFSEDESRISRLLKKMDVDEGRVQKVLAHGAKSALLRKVNSLIDQLKVSRDRVKNIPREIDKEQKALTAALLGK